MEARDLILEIGTEEMPSAAIYAGNEQLKDIATKLFGENKLSFFEIRTYGTPRRLILQVIGLESRQREEKIEIKGPPAKIAFANDGMPTAAAEGFAKSQGIKVSNLKIKETSEGTYAYVIKKEKGKETAKILPKILPDLISSISFLKSMRWQGDTTRFVRPVRWILALYGEEVIRFSFGDLVSGNLTWGHRFFVNNPIEIKGCETYFPSIKKAKVVVDKEERERIIRDDIRGLLKEGSERVVLNPKTLAEVINLVESPHAICGTFLNDYLALPREVLTTAMESHQRYFPVEGVDSKLKSKFIVVHNGDPSYDDIIRRGHERVLSARLADAKFFFEEDGKMPLKDRIEDLKGVVFQEKLGTIYGKVKRVEKLSEFIAERLKVEKLTKDYAKRAAYLSKADLVTAMVIEFPDLQGTMGREYALLSGENEVVAKGIFEHYLPRHSDGILPETSVGNIVSIADKIDSIVGCFSVGFLPTGSEDPYALRRQAQGIISIVLNKKLNLLLTELFDFSFEQFKVEGVKFNQGKEDVLKELQNFFLARLKQQFLNVGFRYDVIDAVLAAGLNNMSVLREKVKVMSKYRDEVLMKDLFTAFIRCKNLAVSKVGMLVDEKLFEQEEEKVLFSVVLLSERDIKKAFEVDNYEKVMKILAELRPAVDKFFDEVLVMAKEKELKNNRIKLLNKCVQVFESVADFSKLAIAAG
ncbi:MAG TPA: glycine--tRNA ligase subunit beta [Actinobacteria bacterium]|nr:glycine--tRNA ligase subunit beta [Actinomycetota bacterium]